MALLFVYIYQGIPRQKSQINGLFLAVKQKVGKNIMSKAFTSKASTTSRGRGRGTNSSNSVRGSIINRGEKQTSSKIPGVGQSTPNRFNNSSRGTARNRGSTTARGGGGRGRGATMYDNDNDMSFSRPRDARMRVNSQSYQADQQPEGSTNRPNGSETNQDRTTHTSGFTMVSPNEKKRRAITERLGDIINNINSYTGIYPDTEATKNLEEYERHKEEQRIQHVSYVGTAGGGLISEEEARRKAAIQHSKASYNSRTKRESYRAAEKENEEMVYRERKMAARRQSELNEEKRKKEEGRHRDEMRRKNAAFLDRLEANKPKPTAPQNNQDTEVSRRDMPVPKSSSEAKGSSPVTQNYANDSVNEDINRLQVMFPHYTRNDLSDLLQQMGSLELTVDILSE
ncbi:hypothetical protein LOTGIDRAFT_231280 [Lottia gigantea]|uniref:CUE domain-containing protein n=1 Tax=Lottia gigantea TaxID=225164 RepID=V4AVD6_LOTGI|nr:hypothetical protein LOTGIDRAFT_231280 [Lottia gigantea]ESO98965.1 hypothetical protein LOTGIDRAFT_231280 [Lottia gigantea]